MINADENWNQDLEHLLRRNPGLKAIDDPGKLEYYRQDLNSDLPPLIKKILLDTKPGLVLQPRSESHIREIFALASKGKVPVTIRGAGTAGFGGAVPTRGGILIDLGLMRRIEIDAEKKLLTVGPGARFLDVERELARRGLALFAMPSGKGGTVAGWIATGGVGLGTFRHGPVSRHVESLRVVTPNGDIRELKAGDPDLPYFISTEGQMGVIVEAVLRVRPAPANWFPCCVAFRNLEDAFAFARESASRKDFRPEDLVVYHSSLAAAQEIASDGNKGRHFVFTAFEDKGDAERFLGFLKERGLEPGDDAAAEKLWAERFLPMAVKSLGPSLLAAEVVLPASRVAEYQRRIDSWGEKLGVAFYPVSHMIDAESTLYLAMIPSDARRSSFFIDLLLVPMLIRLAVEEHGAKPYGLGVWNTPFLGALYPATEVARLRAFKKTADPAGILNPGKFFSSSGRFSTLQKTLFRPGAYGAGLSALRFALFSLFSLLPEKLLRRPLRVRGDEELAREVLSCAQCGSCVGRCPLYAVTGDETMTARGKLLSMRKAFGDGPVSAADALPFYFCLRCGRCDDECQVRLKHRVLFDRLEKSLSVSLPFPSGEISEFIRQMEESPDLQKFLEVIRTGFDHKLSEERQSFPRYRVSIDEEKCLNCATCVDACMYSVRTRGEADPRKVAVSAEMLCRGCGACLERCPQVAAGIAATSVELHPESLAKDDPYWKGEVIGRIDLEATTGKIPVSGTGQGDPHRG
ncbi:MAG TPA: FAD-binding protein, partial [Thermodesulfobacteriota bacterium]|nr:FAD-binding protein [Thermodesulfobacteriota bacterium]